jgi:hypothetical protein
MRRPSRLTTMRACIARRGKACVIHASQSYNHAYPRPQDAVIIIELPLPCFMSSCKGCVWAHLGFACIFVFGLIIAFVFIFVRHPRVNLKNIRPRLRLQTQYASACLSASSSSGGIFALL